MNAATTRIAQVLARTIAPRKPITVSAWADGHRFLSSKGSAEPGRWRTSRNQPLREPMDCLSARSPVRDIVCMFPIQFGKTEIALNALGYTMDQSPGPVMVCLPGEVSLHKWVEQKLNPMIEESPAVKRTLTSVASRDSANRRTFKDFEGGQLYIEHAGSPSRLKSTTVRTLIVDELDEFADSLSTGDDPVAMLEGRTSAFPATSKRLYISTPGIRGVSRVEQLWLKSDQRRWYVPCPDCGHSQPLEWGGLHWTPDGSECWYACRECHVVLEEHQKTAMIAAGAWVPENPEGIIRGYTINALYYQLGLGPRWLDLVRMWREAQNEPAKLKTFINDRLAEPWEDPAMRGVKHNIIADRAEPVPLRPVPPWVLAATAGIDTQDDRLAVQIVGWGRGMCCWPIDYVELPGDPAENAVWDALTDLLLRPIDHASGGFLRIDASAQDGAGHRTEAVKAYARRGLLRRHLVVFGAKPNNAPVLNRGTLVDVNWRGQYDKRGIRIHHVGTVGIKHLLFGHLLADQDKQPEARKVRFSDELSPEYFGGLTSETYNSTRNRFEKRRGGPRNEPLDTWVYAYAATHHPELRLHRYTKANWDALEARVLATVGKTSPPVPTDSRETPSGSAPQRSAVQTPTTADKPGQAPRKGWGKGNQTNKRGWGA
jgi:phage terminase large subunit GpA-like protein